MDSKKPTQSRLLKYARQSGETFSVPVGTKITPSMNKDFVRLCQTLNLTSAEVIRYLIEEELKVWKPIWSQKETEGQEARNQTAAALETNVNYDQTKVNQKKPKKKPDDKPLYAQWRIEGKMPCPICGSWQTNIAAHLKGSHKMTKQKVFTDPKYAEIATKMVEEKSASSD